VNDLDEVWEWLCESSECCENCEAEVRPLLAALSRIEAHVWEIESGEVYYRLRRIEEAARELGGIWDAIDATADDPDAPGVPWNVVEASLTALRSALEEKP